MGQIVEGNRRARFQQLVDENKCEAVYLPFVSTIEKTKVEQRVTDAILCLAQNQVRQVPVIAKRVHDRFDDVRWQLQVLAQNGDVDRLMLEPVDRYDASTANFFHGGRHYTSRHSM